MAKKVKCPACGAKNDVGQHRCRVCTAVIDPTAAEGLPKGLAKQRKQDALLAAARERNTRDFSADELHTDLAEAGSPLSPSADAPPVIGPSYGPVVAEPIAAPVPGPPEAEGPVALPDEAIVIDAPPRHLESPAFEVPVDAPVADEPWDSVAGIEIDVVGRHEVDVPPPIEPVDDSFDPNALVIDPPR